MSVAKHPSQPITSKLLATVFCVSALPLVASAQAHQEWFCKASSNGQWQCQQQQSYNTQVRPLLKTNSNVQQSKQPTSDSQWDWVAKPLLDNPSDCKTGCDGAYVEPPRDWEDSELLPDNAPLRADAASSSFVGDVTTLNGDVLLTQGYRSILADSASLDRNTNQLLVSGNVEIRQPGQLIRADSGSINTETRLGEFKQGSLLQHSTGFRAQAELIKRSDINILTLEGAHFTQCTPDDETWAFETNNLHLNIEEGWGKAKHAKLRVKDIPVLYIPYLTFPIDDRRQTGFLFPTFATGNNNGFEFSAPFYWNIAPNYDATITPRYIEKRGEMLELELRQLNQFGQWVLSGAQLDDDLYSDLPQQQNDETPPQENRWVVNVDHSGKLFGISTNIDYSKVSDEDFFRDFSTDSLELKRTTHLNQQATLGYRNDVWQTALTVQDHQTVDQRLNRQYQLMPRFSLEKNHTANNFETEWLLALEYTDFQHDDSISDGGSFITGSRTFVEAGVSYPMRWSAGFIIPTAKIRDLNYDLDETLNGNDSPSATTPLATLDMGLIFERNFQLSDNNYTQTLEPRLYYFYSEFEDQTSNPDFDSSELTFSYSQLFRDTRFSGHDRLDDANQVSVGITSRFINDSQGREQLTLSLGQIFYFEDREVQLNTLASEDRRSNSNIASEIQYQPYDNLWFSNSLLWDSRKDKIEEGGIGFHYQGNHDSLYNLGYRYRREGGSSLQPDNNDLSQVDASVVLPITDKWTVFARYRYDVEQNYSLDDLFGLQYEDCCWMVRVLYQQSLDDEFINELNNQVVVERDHAVIIEFQLKGLGSVGNKARSLLEESILGYEYLD